MFFTEKKKKKEKKKKTMIFKAITKIFSQKFYGVKMAEPKKGMLGTMNPHPFMQFSLNIPVTKSSSFVEASRKPLIYTRFNHVSL